MVSRLGLITICVEMPMDIVVQGNWSRAYKRRKEGQFQGRKSPAQFWSERLVHVVLSWEHRPKLKLLSHTSLTRKRRKTYCCCFHMHHVRAEQLNRNAKNPSLSEFQSGHVMEELHCMKLMKRDNLLQVFGNIATEHLNPLQDNQRKETIYKICQDTFLDYSKLW